MTLLDTPSAHHNQAITDGKGYFGHRFLYKPRANPARRRLNGGFCQAGERLSRLRGANARPVGRQVDWGILGHRRRQKKHRAGLASSVDRKAFGAIFVQLSIEGLAIEGEHFGGAGFVAARDAKRFEDVFALEFAQSQATGAGAGDEG